VPPLSGARRTADAPSVAALLQSSRIGYKNHSTLLRETFPYHSGGVPFSILITDRPGGDPPEGRTEMNEVRRHIEEHVPALQRYAISLVRNPVAAEDLVQECVVRALTKAKLYKSGSNLRAWLFTILHNLHISEARRVGKWKQPADPEATLAKLSTPASQHPSLMLRSVRKSMMALPDEQRAILYSVGVEGKSYDEVSDEFEIPVGTVKSRCFRAREALQQELNFTWSQESSPSMTA
jgi:RNA polymerase sigma-70 factor (ECF subfamily)